MTDVTKRELDVAMLRRVADFMESHGRDEGGFSSQMRADFHGDADHLRDLANELEGSAGGAPTQEGE